MSDWVADVRPGSPLQDEGPLQCEQCDCLDLARLCRGQLENDGKTRLCFAVICCHDGSSANQREQQQRCAVAEYQLQKQATEFIEFKLTEYLVLTIVWLYFS